MGFNICRTCGACDGRAGMLIQEGPDGVLNCLNCNDSFKQGAFVVHAHLHRTPEELKRQGEALTAYLQKQNDSQEVMNELKGHNKKDIMGRRLELHQQVVCVDQFRTSSGIQNLVKATVVAFTDIQVRVRIEGEKNSILRNPEQLCVIV